MSSRRSGRERKAVQLPNVGTPGGSLTFVKVNTISDQSSNDENDENDAEDEDEDDDDDDDVFAPKRAKNKGATKAKSAAKPKAVGGAKRGGGGSKSKKAFVATVSSQNFIFDALESNSSATKLADTASQWAELFKTDKCVAVVKLVNSVLFSAGVQSDRGIPDTPNDCPDLDAYDAEEINDLLEERGAKETMEANYPLIAKGVQNTFRKRFVLFFQALGTEMGGKKDKDAKKMEEELKSVVEPFMVLSSFQLASLRDAFSEAALVMASTLAKLAKATRDSLDTQRRLQKAEEDHMNKDRPSDKHKAFAKTLDLLTRKLSCCNKLVEEIFASVFVHRSKDVNDQVRVVCMAQLGELIMAYPQEYVSDAFLKYIGWQITDTSVQVRRECGSVLARIAADDEVADRLQDFVTRYREKMLHLASRDKDARVAKTYIALMHRLHDLGMLDEAETEELGEVDQVLFDPTATIDARTEALEFVMAHTEGFDDDDDDEPEEPVPKKGKKGDSAKADESKALARRQKHAVQLETLSELTELHVKDPAQYDNAAKMLTQACLATGPGHVLLRDWSTMTALLLKESNDKITVSLSPALSAILLRMLVSSAESLSDLVEAAAAREEKSAGGKKDADKADLADWMRLGEVLQRDLAKLLKRFGDDHTNLAVLARLLTCCDLGEAPKLMRPLLKALEGIFDTATSSDAGLVSVVCTALRGWTRLGEQASGAVEPVVSSVLKSSWETLEQSLVDLQAIAAQPLMSTSKKSSSKKKGGSQSSQPQVADCVYALDVAVLKQVSLWRALDCRFLSPQTDIAALTDTIVEAMDFVVGLGENADTTPEVEAACTSCAINAAELLFNVLLWLYRDAFKLVQDGSSKKTKSKAAMRKKKKKKQDEEDDEEDENSVVAMEVEEEDLLGEEDEQEYEAAVDAALDVRGKLVDSLLTWMQLGGDDGDDDAPAMHARLQRRAFQLVNDVRVLMPPKARESRYLDRSVFAPSQEVLAGLRRVFEIESKRAQRAVGRIVDDEDEDEAGGSKGQGEAVQHLLLASLSSTIIFDVANLNRRQTAAILCRLDDPDPRVVEVVKTVCLRLKQHAPHKCLEVQMVALKSIYTDAVAPFVAAHLRALEGEADEGFDQAENDAAVDAGRERLSHLAEKLGSNWGVTMSKDAASDLPNFFQICIDFATEDPAQYVFIEVLAHFLRFMPKSKLASLTEHMLGRIEEVAGLEEAIEASDGLGPAQLRIFLKDQLKSGKRGSNKKARLSMTSFTHKSEDSDDDEPFAKPSQRKKAAAKPKAAKRKALPMLKEKPKARPRAQPASKGRGKKRSVYEEEEEEDEEEEQEEEEEEEQDNEPAQQEQQDEEEEEEEEPAPVVKAKSRAKAPAPKAPAPKAPAPKAPAPKAPAPKKASKAKRGSNFFDDDDEEEEEEEEVMPQPAMRVVPVGSKPKMGLTLEEMSADEDEDEDEDEQQEEEEQPRVPVVAASPPKGSKRGHHDITASQNEALAALASIPIRRRYR